MRLKAPDYLRSARSRAMVLKECLAVLALTGLIVLIRLPALGNGLSACNAAVCRNNLRQLILAWQMYSADHHGELVPNAGDVDFNPTWANGWLDYTSAVDNINTDCLIGYEKTGNFGLLGPYVKTTDIFHCPSDTSRVRIFGRFYKRVRSVSMNGWMSGYAYEGESGFRVFRKESDIVGLPPSQAWVIQVEREDSINDSVFEVDMVENIASFPASYHSGGENLVYADGHVGYHQWQDKRTNPEMIKGRLLNLNVPSPNNPDLDWLRARTTLAN